MGSLILSHLALHYIIIGPPKCRTHCLIRVFLIGVYQWFFCLFQLRLTGCPKEPFLLSKTTCRFIIKTLLVNTHGHSPLNQGFYQRHWTLTRNEHSQARIVQNRPIDGGSLCRSGRLRLRGGPNKFLCAIWSVPANFNIKKQKNFIRTEVPGLARKSWGNTGQTTCKGIPKHQLAQACGENFWSTAHLCQNNGPEAVILTAFARMS